MIDLTLNKKRDFKTISEDFYLNVKDPIYKTIKKNKVFLDGYNTKSGEKLGEYLKDNVKALITYELHDVISKFENEFEDLIIKEYVYIKYKDDDEKEKSKPSKFIKVFNKIFDYENHDSWGAYSFTKVLNINCCPYCNRNYITTIGSDESKFVRPDIDHFLPKYEYPYLRLSFYNLVPSCVICNRNAKGSEPTSLNYNIHPYVEGFGDDAKFIYKPKTYKDLIGQGNPEIDFEYSKDKDKVKRIKENIKFFRLKEQYSIHNLELNHLLKLKEAFTDTYIQDLIDRYPNLNLAKEEAYYYAFGLSSSKLNDENQPLSKFKRDILEHIKMINI